MTNIVSLYGDPLNDGRTPITSVVEMCEKLLELAASGEVTGVTCVMHWSDGASGMMRQGVLSYSMIGRLEDAKRLMLTELENS